MTAAQVLGLAALAVAAILASAAATVAVDWWLHR